MLLRLSAVLDIPLRERNTLLLAGGYAPAYRESGLDERNMTQVRSALETMLTAHEPYPAVVVDRCWNVVADNAAMSVLMNSVPGHLMGPRPNVFRLVLHPDGLAPLVVNLHQVRALFLDRLLRQVNSSGDDELRALHEEVSAYPVPDTPEHAAEATHRSSPIEVPLQVRTPDGVMSMFSTMATFGAPADVTLSELAIELFYPLDEFTANVLRSQPSSGAPPAS